MRYIPATVLLVLALTGCTNDETNTPEVVANPTSSSGTTAAPPSTQTVQPTGYRYTLRSYCGYRQLMGTYSVIERKGIVQNVKIVQGNGYHPKPRDIPSLADLLAKAEDARPRAVVHLEVDDNGLPVIVRIDNDPRGQDDEECYDVSDLEPLY